MIFESHQEALKWCLENPDQILADERGRELLFSMKTAEYRDYSLSVFKTNLRDEARIISSLNHTLTPEALKKIDLKTLKPKKDYTPERRMDLLQERISVLESQVLKNEAN